MRRSPTGGFSSRRWPPRRHFGACWRRWASNRDGGPRHRDRVRFRADGTRRHGARGHGGGRPRRISAGRGRGSAGRGRGCPAGISPTVVSASPSATRKEADAQEEHHGDHDLEEPEPVLVTANHLTPHLRVINIPAEALHKRRQKGAKVPTPSRLGPEAAQISGIAPVPLATRVTPRCTWRSARADESDGLENRCGRKATVGSNPTSSAVVKITPSSLVEAPASGPRLTRK
jgi:hypothetical protein